MQKGQPSQQQKPTGTEKKMTPKPESENPNYKAANKFEKKVVLITGGDSGIGKATAITFAKEGASIAIVYLENDDDANETKNRIEELGQECLLIKGDLGQKTFCIEVIKSV